MMNANDNENVWVEISAQDAVGAGKGRWGWRPIAVDEIQALLASDEERAAFARLIVPSGDGGPGRGRMILRAHDGAMRLGRYVEASPAEGAGIVRALLAKEKADVVAAEADRERQSDRGKQEVAGWIAQIAGFPTSPCSGWSYVGRRVLESEHATEEQKREVASMYVTALTTFDLFLAAAREARDCADHMWPEGHEAIRIYDERLAAHVAEQEQEIAAKKAKLAAAKKALLEWASERDADIRAALAEGYDCDKAADDVVVGVIENAVRRLWDPRTIEGARISWIDVEGEGVEHKERRAPSQAILSRRALVAKAIAELELPAGYEVSVGRVQRLEWVANVDEDEDGSRKATGVLIELRSPFHDDRVFPVSLEG